MIKLKDIAGGRVRMTTYTTNEDGTVTYKRYWVDTDGAEEVISEQIIQNEDVFQSLQDTFNQ